MLAHSKIIIAEGIIKPIHKLKDFSSCLVLFVFPFV